jgi:DNA-binding NarL/FixJ family response regulator
MLNMRVTGPRITARNQQVVALFLQGYDNAEIAARLKISLRTVKAHFRKMFLIFGITGGVKRVKLAVALYRGTQHPSDPKIISTGIRTENNLYRNRDLTGREKHVVALISSGLTAFQAGREIGTTTYVIKKYLCRIYDKLGLWNRVELALWYEARRAEAIAAGQPSTP